MESKDHRTKTTMDGTPRRRSDHTVGRSSIYIYKGSKSGNASRSSTHVAPPPTSDTEHDVQVMPIDDSNTDATGIVSMAMKTETISKDERLPEDGAYAHGLSTATATAASMADEAETDSETSANRAASSPIVTRILSIVTSAARRCGRAIWSLLRHGWFPFSYVLYTLFVVALPAIGVMALQASLYPKFAPKKLTAFVTKMWLSGDRQFLVGYAVLVGLYCLLIVLINRFWIATPLFIVLIGSLATANYFKITLRNEPLIPPDLNFIGNPGEIASFIPESGLPLLHGVITFLLICAGVSLCLFIIDSRRSLIPMRRRVRSGCVDAAAATADSSVLTPEKKERRVRTVVMRWLKSRNYIGIIARITLTLLLFSQLFTFMWNVNTPNTWAKKFVKDMSDSAILFDPTQDMQQNGYVLGFARYVHVTAMDEPANYSEDTMRNIAKRYRQQAKRINAERVGQLTDSTVIMVLSESLSDPTRVPGIALDNDPMQYIRDIKQHTTSGLALSTGYGGGTANIEYQALTGLSMANFNHSLAVAYQQLVPTQKWTESFNQLWNDDVDTDGSEAFHSFNRSMYFRGTNYKKFGFSTFHTEDGPDYLTHTDTIDDNEHISDAALYQDIVDTVNDANGSQFLQVITMQNHMPYYDWYADNEYKDYDASEYANDWERADVETYAKGLEYTDEATQNFLNTLDAIDKPITVVFYGDHLPGIYTHAVGNENIDQLSLHMTDYFIWSNAASASAETKLDDDNAGVTSSNYFMALAAQHMDATVTPYLAFLTRMREAIAAIGPAGAAGDGGDFPVYLDSAGMRIGEDALTDEQRNLLQDYRLIQYDMTIGKGYLKDLDFVTY